MNIRILFFIPLAIFLLSFLNSSEKGNQRAFYECTEPINIDTTLFEVREGQTYFYFNKSLKPNKMKSKGFVWLDDKPKNYFIA